MSEELKPCPFCKTSRAYTTSSGHTEHYVECEDCGCSGPVAVNEIKAIAAWNRRPTPPAAKAVEMDAARYRGLREWLQTTSQLRLIRDCKRTDNTVGDTWVFYPTAVLGCEHVSWANDPDAAIDAALSKQGGNRG